LEAKGYVDRKRSEGYERVVEIRLTTAGEGLKEKAHFIPRQII